MSTNTTEARDLLRLYKCVVDTGTDVLTAFANYKLLPTYNGNFKHFLDDKKHELFHLWQSRKFLCCECPPAGYNLKQTGHMPNWIFKKIYDDSGTEDRGHIVRNSGNVVQVCLHKYVTRNIAIHELDISTISFLLRNLAVLSQNETSSLDLITTTRSQICHAYSTNCYPLAILNTTWTELENALVDLVDPSFKRIIRKDIKQLRKADLEKEEITELMKNVEEVKIVLEAVESSCNNNINHFKGMESRLENMSITNTEDIKHHTTEQTNFVATQAQHAISEKIQNTEEKLEHCIRHEAERMNASQASSFQQLGSTLQETRTQIKEVKENQDKTQGEILRAIENLTLSVKYERPANLLVPEETFTESMECPVLWQIATPEHWNLEVVEATLRNPSNKDEQFKKKFVRKGSLIMLTTIAASILSDPNAFEAAVIAFLTKMITDCDIDTAIPSRVDVRLHILNANEVSMSCELPLQVQHTQGSGFTKQRTLLEQYDIAFLNSDNYDEIMWVKRASILLEDTFGIKCAIPGRDYLFGLPIDELDIYFNQFKAVIVTLTKDSHIALRYAINTFESSIVVELDYMKKIPFHLINIPHINGTSCEHLWFSNLSMEIRKRHPDLENKFAPKINEEPVLDCKRCTSIASTAVYHKLTFVPDPPDARIKALFCGSLITESFIINLCNKLSNCKELVHIRRWKKTTDVPRRIEKQDIAIVFVSKHLKTCDSLEKCCISPRKRGNVKWYSTRIEETEIPAFITNLTEDINVPCMNPDLIAVEITTLLENLMFDKVRHKKIDSSLSYDDISESQRDLTDSTLYYDEYSETYNKFFASEASLRMKDIPPVYTDPFEIGSESTESTTKESWEQQLLDG